MKVGFYDNSEYAYWVENPSKLRFTDIEDYHDVMARNIEIFAWVEQTFGAKNLTEWGTGRWQASNNKYYFKYESDRTLFILRWS